MELGLLLAAFIAGMVDAVVGGGGLIQVPALFVAVPNAAPATLFGTNKFASIFGTGSAAWRYLQKVRLPWKTVLPAVVAAFLFAYLGAAAVAWIPKEILQPLIIVLLGGVLAYTLANKNFGQEHRPRQNGKKQILLGTFLGSVIGFYDGFFGPGTGSFLVFLFIRGFGFDFLHASAAAKIVNAATNLAALSYFLPAGHCLWLTAVLMALCNTGGALLGTRLALAYGSAFMRIVFLLVAGGLLLRLSWDFLA